MGHYHGYIIEDITDTSENQSWYKAEDSEEVKTISDKMVKQDLSNAYSFVYLKQQDNNEVINIEDDIVLSDDESDSTKTCEETIKVSGDNAENIVEDSSDELDIGTQNTSMEDENKVTIENMGEVCSDTEEEPEEHFNSEKATTDEQIQDELI